MNLLRLALLPAAALLFAVSQVSAASFTIGGTSASSYDTYWAHGSEPSPFNAASSFKVNFEDSGDVVEGTFGASYFTWSLNPAASGQPEYVQVSWPSLFDFELTAVWLKTGKGKNGLSDWYAVDLSGFNSNTFDGLRLYNPDAEGISHFTLIGRGTSVPDSASTLALLGLGLGALGFVARRRKA